MRRGGIGLIALVALVALTSPLLGQRVVDAPINIRTAPERDGVFVSWSTLPNATYTVRWRARGATAWQTESAGDRSWAHVAVEPVSAWTEVQVVARTSGGEVASPIVVDRASPTNRCDDLADSLGNRFACTRAGLARRFREAALGDGARWTCRVSAYAAEDTVPPNCRYSVGGTIVGLNRFIGASFRADPFLLSKADAQRIGRRAIFGNADPFENAPAPPLVSVSAPPIVELAGVEQFTSWIVELGPELYSRITWLTPESPVPGRYVVYQEGHTGGNGSALRIGAKTIERFLADGWEVIVLDLPLDGANDGDISFTYSEHDALRPLTAAPASPLRPMFLPLVSATDAIIAAHRRRSTTGEGASVDPTILLYGRSTGALLACVYGAVDPRIDVSVSDAGCPPESTLLEPGVFNGDIDLNHLEASIPTITDQISIAQLAITAGRLGSFFFYSVNDPITTRYAPTHPWVRYLEAADNIAARRVRVHVGTQAGHGIEDAAWRALQEFLAEVGIRTSSNGALPPLRVRP